MMCCASAIFVEAQRRLICAALFMDQYLLVRPETRRCVVDVYHHLLLLGVFLFHSSFRPPVRHEQDSRSMSHDEASSAEFLLTIHTCMLISGHDVFNQMLHSLQAPRLRITSWQ